MKRKITAIALIMSLIVISNLFGAYPVNADGKSPFVKVVKDIRESVVNIKVEYEVSGGVRQMDDFFKFFFPDPNRMPQIQPQKRKAVGMGSGFIFKRKGNDVYIITNNHVVENGDKENNGEITVTLADKAKYPGEIVGLDEESDLAVIKIEVEKDEKVVTAPLGRLLSEILSGNPAWNARLQSV